MTKAKSSRFFLISFFLVIFIAALFAFLFLRPKKEDIIRIDNDWFYVINSSIQDDYTGIKSNENGLWRIVNGKVDFEANGLFEDNEKLFYVVNGKVDVEANGLFLIDSELWYLKDGEVDRSFSGIDSYDSVLWRVDGGKVDTEFSGFYETEDASYNIVNGQAVLQMEEHYFQKNDGSTLSGFVYKPAVFNGKTMIFCHGVADTADRGLNLAGFLAEKGYTVFAFDFAGGGAYSRSDGDTTEMSVLTELADLEEIYDHVASQPYVNEDSIYLAGHSQGGIVSGMFAAANPSKVKALILYAPGFVVCKNWAPGSIDEIPEGESYIDNDMFVGPRYFQDLWKLLEGEGDRIYSILSAYDGPVLMLHGTADMITPIDYTREMCDHYNNETLIEYDGADHCFEGEEFQEALASDTLEFLENH